MKTPAEQARQAPGEGGAPRAVTTSAEPAAGPARGTDAGSDAARPAGAPRAAEDLGLADRYRYLSGASGARYLFSVVPAEALEDFRGAVVVIELGRRRGAAADAARTVWIGEIDRYGTRRGPPLTRAGLRGRPALVHLLAGRSAQRREVLEDLAAALRAEGVNALCG